MNGIPEKNNKKSSRFTSVWSGVKSFSKSLSREVVINFLAGLLEKGGQLIKDSLPAVISIIVTLLVSVYVAIARFTGQIFSITGGQILIILGFVILFMLAVIYAPSIRKKQIASKEEFVSIFGLDWKKSENQLIGPYCPFCSKEVISESMLVETMDQVLDGMFGEQSSYTYSCSRCGQKLKLDGPLEQMKKEVNKRFFET